MSRATLRTGSAGLRASPPAHRPGRRGFTLVELLVVIAILALLLTVLMPSLARVRELAKRTLCMTRLHGIGRGVGTYAADYDGFVFPCRFRCVQICLNPRISGGTGEDAIDWVKAAASVGLEGKYWECPGRPGSVQWEMGYPQMMLGYQYFGGVDEWWNPWGTFRSRSPCDLDDSEPHWVLAADCTMKIDQVWGGGRPTAYGNMPQHRWENAWPEGGNHLHVDGSVKWVEFEKMIFIHSWGGWNRIAYFYQDDLGDYDPPTQAEARP